MQSLHLNADLAKPAIVDGGALPWHRSPAAGVERRYLERLGGEAARATSIVSYAPGSRFAPHTHPQGEELLVLQGCFSDEHGDYPAGSYVRNPPGSTHAPFSDGGCVIFVKLCHMPTHEAGRVVRHAAHHAWRPSGPGREEALLHRQGSARVSLQRCEANAPTLCWAGGVELLVLAGALREVGEDGAACGPWTWMRMPRSQQRMFQASEGALLWVAQGHIG